MDKKSQAKKIVETLIQNDFEAYWVGGSVRDLLLKKEPKDIDIVTSAKPEDIERIFDHTHAIGKQFGVMLVGIGENTFEVATFRKESEYVDKRRPSQVEWTTAKQDVLRRDFTVNGLLFDPIEEKVIDFVNGRRDLEQKIIRFIGEPKERISEDPLRILRAVRLKNQLGFSFDKATFDAIKDLGEEINHVAKERIGNELDLMLGSDNRSKAIQDLDKLGLLAIILPEIDELKGTPQPQEFHQEGDVFDHSLKALSTLTPDAPSFLAFAVLFHDSGKPKVLKYPQNSNERITTYGHARVSANIAEQVLRRLKFSRTYLDTVTWLISHHMSLKNLDELRPNKRELFLLDPRFPWLLELHRADALGAKPADLSLYIKDMQLYEKVKEDHKKTIASAKPLLVNGFDLQRELKIAPGLVIGELLELIRDKQLRGEIQTKDEAITFAQEYLKKDSI